MRFSYNVSGDYEFQSTRNVTLLLVLPSERHGLEHLMERLTGEHVLQFFNYSSPEHWEPVQVTVPPFNINASIDLIPHLSKVRVMHYIASSSSRTSLFILLIAVSVVEEFLWITYMKTDPTGGPPMICGQQSPGASSEENTGQNMYKG